jgi:hypothetical protein
VPDIVERLKNALGAKYVMLGGGNAKNIEKLPPDTCLGDNRNAFMSGFRLSVRKRKALPALVSGGSAIRAAAKKGFRDDRLPFGRAGSLRRDR